MSTITVTTPTVGDDVTPAYTTCTAADKFAATGGKFLVYYKNGAGGAFTASFALNAATAAPAGTVPAAAANATNWADLRLSNGIPISTDAVCVIPDAAPYIDATGFVNLKHTGLTGTPTVAVVGPL